MIIKILIILAMLAIMVSLFRSLYFLATEKSESKKTVRGLSWRIGLSIGLFLLIVLSIYMGWLEPHGLPIVNKP
jgi:branched-subunit amino acid transport protein AzlD